MTLRTPLLSATCALAVSACASAPLLRTPPAQRPGAAAPVAAETLARASDKGLTTGATNVLAIPGPPPPPTRPAPPPATPEEIARIAPDAPVDVLLTPQPVAQFADTVFGELLKLPYVLGPGVAQRTEIISVRSAPRMSQRAFLGLVQTALRDYGLVLSISGGAVQINEGGPQATGARTTVLRTRSTVDTPASSRTVTQFVQLYAVDAAAMTPLLQDLFPGARSVRITPQAVGNFLVVTGAGRDVAATVDMIASLDTPRFAGAQVARIEPTYWRADAFARALSDALVTEGFQVSNQPNTPKGIMVLTLGPVNQVLAFAGDPGVMERVRFWARELDRPSAVGDQRSTFVYNVKNTDASALGSLARGQSPQTFSPLPPVGVGTPGQSPLAASAAGPNQTPQGIISTTPTFVEGQNSGQAPGGGNIVVDSIGNRIVFTGSATQYAQVHDLLVQLDVPPRQVLIEVTVAEVTLNDVTRVGLEWFFDHSEQGQNINGGTRGGLGINTAQGLVLNYTNTLIPGIQNLQAQFNAFASNNNVNILSRPRIVAKSGGDAQIQVGTDIPIISSQAAGGIQTGGTTQVLQTVQYRQTGVILKVRPTVYGEDRVDLEISQEVSNQAGSTSGAIASPTIQNRSISTALSLQDGATAVLGGLISNSYSKGNTGIPFLKDIPIVGAAFRTDTIGGDRDELVILVTPHIIQDAAEMSAVAEGLSAEVNRAFRVGTGWSYTLTPFTTGFNLGNGPPPRSTSPDLNAAIGTVRAGPAAGAVPAPAASLTGAQSTMTPTPPAASPAGPG